MARNSGTSINRPADNSLLPLIGFLICFLPSFSANALTNYPVAWESQFHPLPQDSNGWTILTPSADSRVIYVSSSSGNDSSCGYYTPSNSLIGGNAFLPAGAIVPCATIAKAMSFARSGYADYVLLKRGDTWSITSAINMLTGRSYTERFVLSYYGSSASRPTINIANVAGFSAVNWYNGGDYSVLMGIQFYAPFADPNNAAFTSVANVANNISGFTGLKNNGTQFVGVLVEDCKTAYVTSNIMQSVGNPTTSSTANVTIRRNVFSYTYSSQGNATESLFFYQQPFLFEENVIDHSGWLIKANGQSGGGQANIFSQGTYMDASHNSIARKNMYLRAGSLSMKFRADAANGQNSVVMNNLLVDNNLIVDGEIAVSLGGNTTYNNGARFGNVYVVNNVLTDIGASNPTNRGLGQGLDLLDFNGGLVSGNIATHWGDSTVNSTFAISTKGTFINVPIKDNIFYDVTTMGTWQNNNPIARISETSLLSNVAWSNNVFSMPRGGPLLSVSGSGPTFTGNSYYTASSSNMLTLAGAIQTLNNWVANTGEGSSAIGQKAYVDPARTVKTYLTAKGQTATTDNLANIVTQQSKFNWNGSYTADAINNYIRAGFCISGSNCGSTTISQPPAAPLNFKVDSLIN